MTGSYQRPSHTPRLRECGPDARHLHRERERRVREQGRRARPRFSGRRLKPSHQALYESIPSEHRPPLNASHILPVLTLTDGIQTAIGSTSCSLSDAFRIKIYALVLERLGMGMFVAGGTGPVAMMQFRKGTPVHVLRFGDAGKEDEVQGC